MVPVVSDIPSGDRETKFILMGDPRFSGLSEEHVRRAEEVLNGSNLVEMILYAHLLLEQALENLIRAAFRRPNVLVDRDFARLTFAQKITVFVGLYDPDEETVWELRAFNRLRNRMAHSLVDLESEVLKAFASSRDDTHAQDLIRAYFVSLVSLGLGAVHGVGLVDVEDGSPTGGGMFSRLSDHGWLIGSRESGDKELKPADGAVGGQSWWPWRAGQRAGEEASADPAV